MTAIKSSPCIRSIVFSSTDVLPAPGEPMKLTTKTPFA